MNKLKDNIKVRPFLKWPGNKYRLIDFILPKLPQKKVLIEPFLGSGAVFLNTNYENYILSDANSHVINLYKILKQYGDEFITFCSQFFISTNNVAIEYYKIREKFNNMNDDPITKAALFLYLNRHCYNGLCRFNKKNKFNVPFGRHNNIIFPAKAMKVFFLKSQRAKFFVRDFKESLTKVIQHNSVVYCDPPYVPLSNTANFINYQADGFDLNNQKVLADLAAKLSKKGVPVLISNHFTCFTKKIYSQATTFTTFQVKRMISCKAESRNYVTEMLALYS